MPAYFRKESPTIKRGISLVLISLATLLFCYGVAQNFLQPGHVLREWGWGYHSAIFKLPRLGIPIAVFLLSLCVCVVLARFFHSRRVDRRFEFASLAVILIFGFLIQMSIVSLGIYGFTDLPIITVNEHKASYLFDMVKIKDMGQFLRDFPVVVNRLSGHSAGHPPGPILFFWLAKLLVQKFAFLQEIVFKVGFQLRINHPYLATVDLLLRDSVIYATSLLSSLLMPFLATLTVFPLYYLGKEYYNQRVGLYAALLFLCVPSVILFTPQMDQVFMFLAAGTVCGAFIGLKRKNLFYIALSSILFSIGMFMSVAFFVVLSILGLVVAGFYIKRESSSGESLDIFREGFFLKAATLFFAAVLLFYLSLWLLFGFNMVKTVYVILAGQQRFNVEMTRTYSKWILYNLYDFFAFLGIPLTFLFVRKLVLAFSEAKKSMRHFDVLFFAFLATLLILDLSRTTLGEVARMWLFLVPFAVLFGASTLDTVISRSAGDKKETSSFRGVLFSISLILCLQFAQTVVFKAFLERLASQGFRFMRNLVDY